MLPSIDLRAAVAKKPLRLEGLETLSQSELDAAAAHWQVHMAAEFASARVFAGLVPQLMAASLPFEDVRDVVEMARQEIEHGVQSARVYAALGGDPVSALPPLEPMPEHHGLDPLEVVLRNVIAISCCGETLAVAVIGGERERSVHQPLREILTRILSDEVGHARFGWKLLERVASSLDHEAKRRLSAYLVAVFERDLGEMRGCAEGPAASFAALAVGANDGPLAWSTFVDCVENVTIPGLERHGLHARWAFDKACARLGVTLPARAVSACA
jgi:hypothetical protein